MNRQILCSWLGLPEQNWPPDHFALLGVDPSLSDSAQIEQKVHERLAKLRGYQLSHPEEATEGMNRLAQAYITVTEELARRTQPNQSAPTATLPAPAVEPATVIDEGTELDWKAAAPPVRASDSEVLPVVKNGTPVAVPCAPPPAAAPVREPIDPLIELACHSREARRGLGTLLKLIDRIDRTRQLLVAWKKAGCYLGKPRRRCARPAEEKDLEKRLNAIFEHIQDYPHFVGQPGRPGYRVVAMARLEMTAFMFKSLDEQQRIHLAKDWQAGHDVLLAHRKFLRVRFKTMRRENWLKRTLRALRAPINDHPLRVAAVVVLFAVLCGGLYLFWR